jgi:hypothetical protein
MPPRVDIHRERRLSALVETVCSSRPSMDLTQGEQLRLLNGPTTNWETVTLAHRPSGPASAANTVSSSGDGPAAPVGEQVGDGHVSLARPGFEDYPAEVLGPGVADDVFEFSEGFLDLVAAAGNSRTTSSSMPPTSQTPLLAGRHRAPRAASAIASPPWRAPRQPGRRGRGRGRRAPGGHLEVLDGVGDHRALTGPARDRHRRRRRARMAA